MTGGPDESGETDPVDLGVNAETVQFLVDRAREFQMLGQGESDDSIDSRDPAYDEVRATIRDLDPDQQVALVGLMWLGRGDYTLAEWPKALADAAAGWNDRTAEYLLGTPLLADYLSEGMDQLGVDLD